MVWQKNKNNVSSINLWFTKQEPRNWQTLTISAIQLAWNTILMFISTFSLVGFPTVPLTTKNTKRLAGNQDGGS